MNDPRVEELLEQCYVTQVEGRAWEPDDGCPANDGRQSPEVLLMAANLGFIDADREKLLLTDAGRSAAAEVVRRHRLAECLLHDVLAVSEDQVDQDACRFEHIIRPGVEERICVLLGHPTRCPHGRPIPPGDCCRKAQLDGLKDVSALCDGKAGHGGLVAYLETRDQREIQKLMAIGVVPGVDIQLLRRFPSFVFQMGYSQFTVDRDLARKIIVHWKKQ